jgi:UDP-GlcNAc:undecaprenyl-phosphate GlcNAc-1-phosphate transferase
MMSGRPEPIDALLAFLIAAILAWLLVPFAERLARRVGAIDYPNERSIHVDPTPKLSGLAILIAILVGGLIFLPWVPITQAVLTGAVVIAIVGIFDDLWNLPPALKLAGQAVAAAIPVLNGVQVANFTVPFFGRIDLAGVDLVNAPVIGEIHLGHVLTVLGIVAVINVINLIDGVDGLAAGVCLIAAGTLSIIAV